MSLESKSLTAVPLYTGTVESYRIEKSCTVALGLGTSAKLLHQSVVSSIPNGTMPCCFVVFLTPFWSALAVCMPHTLMGVVWFFCHLLPAMKMCLWSTWCLVKKYQIPCVFNLSVWHLLSCLTLCLVLQWNTLFCECICHQLSHYLLIFVYTRTCVVHLSIWILFQLGFIEL